MTTGTAFVNRTLAVGLCAGLTALLVGCGDDKAVDVTGVYTLNVTNGVNDCMLASWTPGQVSAGAVTVTLTASPSDPHQVTATIGGTGALIDALFKLAYGSNVLTGTVSGNAITLDLLGGKQADMIGACTYTPTAHVDATLSGDTLTGVIYHRYKTNQVPDCSYRNSCGNVQNFNGTRPPKS